MDIDDKMKDIIIPEQLKKELLRFCLLIKGTKKSFQDHNNINYSYNDRYFNQMLKLGYNYGVLGGYGNLIIIDIDDNEFVDKFQELNLPATFTVQSALKKKPHLYYFTENKKKSESLKKKFDIRGIGTYAVGSSSILDDFGTIKSYEISNNIPIAYLSDVDYSKILQLKHDSDQRNITKPSQQLLQKNVVKTTIKDSHYIENKKQFFSNPTDFIIEDVVRISTRGTYDIKVSSLDGSIKDKSFDLSRNEMLSFLKKCLPNLKITLESRRYGKDYFSLMVTDVKR